MKIGYTNNKIKKNCDLARKKWGTQLGGKVLQRLAELAAFNTLADVPHQPPQRCHQYEGNAYRFSVDLTANFRLIFMPAEPFEVKEGIGIVKESVKAIIILSVEDPH